MTEDETSVERSASDAPLCEDRSRNELADDLLPCPFCGGDNVKTFGPYGWYGNWGISHSCKSFYSGSQEMFQGFNSEAEAIAAWNTRTPSQASGRDAVLDVRAFLRRWSDTIPNQPFVGDLRRMASSMSPSEIEAFHRALSPTPSPISDDDGEAGR